MRWIRYVVVAAAVTAPQLCFAEVLDSFVGHFPFDKVSGRNVYQVAKVRQSMDKLLGKQRPKITRALRDFDRGGAIEALEELATRPADICIPMHAACLREPGGAVPAAGWRGCGRVPLPVRQGGVWNDDGVDRARLADDHQKLRKRMLHGGK